jgi:hypothetical protein
MAIGWGVFDNFSTSNGVESPSPSFALYPIHLENLSFAVEKTIGLNLDGV